MKATPQDAHKAPRNNALAAARRHFSTEQLADLLLIRPQTVRTGYCRDGHYCGLVPLKLPSRRLLWAAAEVDALIAGQPVNTPDTAYLATHKAQKTARHAIADKTTTVVGGAA